MKTIVLLLAVLLLAGPFARGMGYPQDMFAEHIAVKTVKKKKPTLLLRKRGPVKIFPATPQKAAKPVPTSVPRQVGAETSLGPRSPLVDTSSIQQLLTSLGNRLLAYFTS